MLDVFFTVDVEIWCGGWKNIDAKFPQAFQQYVYGRTARGEYGLRYQLQQLRDHGLYGVFFVEPLFATRFGIAPLTEIIGLIKEYGQEVQLHMHPEWVDESLKPLLPKIRRKRPFMRDFSLQDQTTLIAAGIQLITDAGGGQVNAFRAGSFGFNENTLAALAANNIPFDSSYNASMMGLDSGIMPGDALYDTIEFDTLTSDTLTSVTPASSCLSSSALGTGRIIEYPMTVFNDGSGSLRHAQLGACSNWELESLMCQALEEQRKAFVILSHNFELLNTARDNADPIMIRRFRKYCEFMANNKDRFTMRGFHDLVPKTAKHSHPVLTSSRWLTLHRTIEQVWRRRY